MFAKFDPQERIYLALVPAIRGIYLDGQKQYLDRVKTLIISISLGVASWAIQAPADHTEIGIDPGRITVSGISAGADMAHQLHLAYPEIFSGAGIVAGAPFGCAAGSLTTAFAGCMAQAGNNLGTDALLDAISSAENSGAVGNQELLSDDRAWVFHGQLDTVIGGDVVDATAALYREILRPENLKYVTQVPAAHTFPTLDQGTACDVVASPFLGACDYDTAGEILMFLYPGLEAPTGQIDAEPLETRIAGDAAGLDDRAWLFVPAKCTAPGAQCALHLVLHGCSQSHSQVGMEFIESSGYLPWAAANGIVLAFPQVKPSAVNPLACWDWWGYTGVDYLSRSGSQMKVLADWVRELAGLDD